MMYFRFVLILFFFSLNTSPMSAQRKTNHEMAEYLLEEAGKGDRAAQYRIYKESGRNGFAFREDIRLYYLEEVAKSDYLPAILDLAGEKRKQKKYKEEVVWLERGIQLGSGEAMCRLAQNYEKGEGVPRNIEQAKALLNKAIKLKYLRAKTELRIIEGKNISPMERFWEEVQIKWYDSRKNDMLLHKASETFYRSLFLWAGLAFRYIDTKWWATLLILLSTIAIPALFLYVNFVAGRMDETRNRYFRPFNATWVFAGCGATVGMVCIFGSPDNSLFAVLACVMGIAALYGIIGILFFSTGIAALLIRLLFFIFLSVTGYFIGIATSLLAVLAVIFMLFGSRGFKTIGRSSANAAQESDPNSGEEKQWDAVTTDEHGYERKLKESGFNSYEDDQGRRWKDAGWGKIKRDD